MGALSREHAREDALGESPGGHNFSAFDGSSRDAGDESPTFLFEWFRAFWAAFSGQAQRLESPPHPVALRRERELAAAFPAGGVGESGSAFESAGCKFEMPPDGSGAGDAPLAAEDCAVPFRDSLSADVAMFDASALDRPP